jgi:hypothetical protein
MAIPASAVGGIPRFEVPTGVIDGSNKVFQTQFPYIAETTAVFINGKMYRRDWDDGWAETDPDDGLVTLNEAPFLGDDVQIFYIDRTAAPRVAEVQRLVGRIQEIQSLQGHVQGEETLRAVVADSDELSGRAVEEAPVFGSLQEVEVLVGRVEVC